MELILRPKHLDVELARQTANDLFWNFRMDAGKVKEHLLARSFTLLREGEPKLLEKVTKV